MAISAYIYKHENTSCSAGGISDRHDTVMVYDPLKETPPETKLPLVKVVRRDIMGGEYVHVEPDQQVSKGFRGWMAGGCFVDSSDSRFHQLIGHPYPVSLHDRQEWVPVHDN